MRSRFTSSLFIAIYVSIFCCHLAWSQQIPGSAGQVITGAERMSEYLPLTQGKRLALVVNQTSVVGKTHLVDTLLSLHQQVQKIFAPEHGFRGIADAGEEISSSLDAKTGIPIISIYGKNNKPGADQLKDVDLVIYDIQDVGVRFYTYVSTLHFVMEACAENRVPLLILDRPDPNGFYVDGPILDSAHHSFVGVDPVPIVYGMTAAEYARMLQGEKWIDSAAHLE